MLREHRFRKIEDALARQPFLEVKAVARRLGVSDATIRRDLEALHQAGRLKRTRGGAMNSDSASRKATQAAGVHNDSASDVVSSNGLAAGVSALVQDTLERIPSFAQRSEVRAEAKVRIGKAAAALVGDGQSVLIGGGTTCYAAAKFLRHRHISVVTNSLPTATLLGETLGVDVLVTGGMVYPKHHILIGPQLKQTLDDVRAVDLVLLGAGGADAEGFYDSNHWEIEAQRELMARGNRVALLLDAAKFARRDLVFVADWSQIDILVTDAELDDTMMTELRRANVQVIVARE